MLNLKNLELRSEPFPHFFVNNFIEKNKFIQLYNNFPTVDWFGGGKNGDGRKTSHTNRFNLSAGQYGETNFDAFMAKDENKCWKELYQEVSSVKFRQTVLNLFETELDKNSYIESEFSPITFDVSYQTDGYVNPPHLDTPYHVFQAIVYLSTENIEQGGNITLWKDQKIAKCYEVKNNSCLIWLNTSDSYHAAYPELRGERRLIYIGIDSVLPTCWGNRAAPKTHKFDFKNAKSPWRIYDFSKNVFI